MPGDMDASRAVWRKSTRSGSDGGNCVEVAAIGSMIAIRDSKDPSGPVLMISADAFKAFLAAIRNGDFDL